MAHINFHALAAPERKRHTRTFTDPGLPGVELVLTLEEPDALTDYLAGELANEMVKRYIEGDPELGMPPQPFMVGSEAKQLTVALCYDACHVVAMQPRDMAEPYQPEEVLQMALKARAMWIAVRQWMRELSHVAEQSLPNASRAFAAPSSDPPSNGVSSTPPLSTTYAEPSGASTNDLPVAKA